MTYEEAMRACVAQGWHETECSQAVADRMVGGVYCDGTIVQDASGARCVSSELAARVAAARAASPLPSTQQGSSSGAWLVLAALVAIIVWR